MDTGYVLLLFIFPLFLEGCCVGSHQRRRTGLQQDQHYKAVDGEIFMMPCNESLKSVWVRTGVHRSRSFDCGEMFSAKVKYSGNYTDRKGGSKLVFQVVEKISQSEESSKMLIMGEGGKVPCPGLNSSTNTDVIWYKGNKTMSKEPRQSCEKGGLLHLCQVDKLDTGVYFCDRQIIEHGITWTFRRAVNVTAIPFETPSKRPKITYPDGNTVEQVELGRPHTLKCQVDFPFEIKFSPNMQWYMNYGGNMKNMTLLPMKNVEQKRAKSEQVIEVTWRAIIKEVTPQHLNHSYTCIATNPVGNSSVTMELRRKIKVKWPSLVGYPIASFLLVAGLAVILHVKWLEVQLIYRSHLQYGKHDGDEKEFDVFLSYVWSPPSAEVVKGSALSTGSALYNDEEACLCSTDLLNTEGGTATKRPLEVLLPQLLEDQWGYRLCLLERDVLPGGAYTNDVVLAIKRSRMLICILSADYFANSNAVFVLESGVQALLQKSTLKLLLIWTSGASVSFIQPDPPLPTLVQRALRVLPSLDWTAGKSAKATSNFWRSLRKAMPNHRK